MSFRLACKIRTSYHFPDKVAQWGAVWSKGLTRLYSNQAMDSWGYLVSPAELAQGLESSRRHSSSSRIVPLCGSWFLPNDKEGRTGFATFKESRIPAAVFFDIDKVKDNRSPYPHMLPSVSDFEKAMSDLGVSNDDVVVVYDTKELGIFSAPRVAWTLKVFGHQKVHILNNFRIWVEHSYPVESGEPTPPKPTSYKVERDFRSEKSVDFDFVKDIVKNKREGVVLDARPNGRFMGKDPEPRPGLPSGHMPRSISLPFSDVLDPESKAILPADALKKILSTKTIDTSSFIVSSCGTGVSAAVIDTALSQAGVPEVNRVIYDGSWTEWAQRAGQDEGLILKE